MEKKSFLEKLNSKWVTPLFAIIAIIYGFIFKVNSDHLEKNSKKLEIIQKQIESEQRQKEFNNNLRLTIYKEVKEAIAQKDSSLQSATLIVVNEMLKDDSVFREKLKTVLFASTSSNKLIETQQKIDRFKVDEKLTQSKGFKIDVFYLDAIQDESKPRAQKIVEILQKKYPKYKIRLRLLPKQVNAQSQYRVDANQIRFEPSESKIATNVLKIIRDENVFDLEQPQLRVSRYKTPNYISVFVRNM
jgi:hypothetical protein